jgi:hypothetical protein
MQYVDQATGTLRDLGITPTRPDFAPINALLEKISDLDRDRIPAFPAPWVKRKCSTKSCAIRPRRWT